jgi:hypothetical protein
MKLPKPDKKLPKAANLWDILAVPWAGRFYLFITLLISDIQPVRDFLLSLCTLVHIISYMSYEWDPNKEKSNYKKHRVKIADAVGVFEDEMPSRFRISRKAKTVL